ncbi:LysM peptidoglycan-binding domain-containing protein [Cellulomonas aerilata]|uniref:LysM domain-containing protein n=1 Tax=Cellulomonas aerilata TaxID=515326 RepID=A0A512DGG8_9CELL|nr:LysM peptidoglycan-binding domain-containing protein [Cellulomonas aerilata]GEO35578.1 hypothetical protein CAE01nite_33030 [Cellulomonas aerilata]
MSAALMAPRVPTAPRVTSSPRRTTAPATAPRVTTAAPATAQGLAQARTAAHAPTAQVPTTQPAGGALALTARGRWVVRSLAVVVAGLALLTGGRAVAEGPGAPVAVDSYTVGAGETLWTIAAAYTAPGEDVRDVVDDLTELNGMSGSRLTAGDQILVPVRH